MIYLALLKFILLILGIFAFVSALMWFLMFIASIFITEDLKTSWEEFNPKSLTGYIFKDVLHFKKKGKTNEQNK
jgi:membrane glycosyltransferase